MLLHVEYVKIDFISHFCIKQEKKKGKTKFLSERHEKYFSTRNEFLIKFSHFKKNLRCTLCAKKKKELLKEQNARWERKKKWESCN